MSPYSGLIGSYCKHDLIHRWLVPSGPYFSSLGTLKQGPSSLSASLLSKLCQYASATLGIEAFDGLVMWHFDWAVIPI